MKNGKALTTVTLSAMLLGSSFYGGPIDTAEAKENSNVQDNKENNGKGIALGHYELSADQKKVVMDKVKESELNSKEAVAELINSMIVSNNQEFIEKATHETTDTILLMEGEYSLNRQLIIDKNLTVVGNSKDNTTIHINFDTESNGDARGAILVEKDSEFNLSGVTLDGSEHEVHQAIRSNGNGKISDNHFYNIKYEKYYGTGIVSFENTTIENNTFSEIGRVGISVYYPNVTNTIVSGNTFLGKGKGDWLDYAIEVGGGAKATITDNKISNNTGVAASDGSTSAGILVSSYYAKDGNKTKAFISGNTFSESTSGISVGYNKEDDSVVDIIGNTFKVLDYGVAVVGKSGENGITINGVHEQTEGDIENALVSSDDMNEFQRVTNKVSVEVSPIPKTIVLASSVNQRAYGTTEEKFTGNGSWKVDSTGGKMEQYLDLTSAAEVSPFKVKDIESISYATKRGMANQNLDFSFEIYTSPDKNNDDASWYGRRLTTEPMYSNEGSDVTGWNTWSTNEGAHQLVFYDGNRTNSGFYGGAPTLADITAGAVNWGAYPNSNSVDVIDYSNETVSAFKFGTGSGWKDFVGYIDNIIITLKDGTKITFDLEA